MFLKEGRDTIKQLTLLFLKIECKKWGWGWGVGDSLSHRQGK